MIRLLLGYSAGSLRALRHAHAGVQALRRVGVQAHAQSYPSAEDALAEGDAADAWVHAGSEAAPGPAWRLAAVGERQPTGCRLVLRSESTLRAEGPMVLWAEHPVWADQWQATHPAHQVYAVSGTTGALLGALEASTADALLISADLLPDAREGDADAAAALVPPLHQGLPLWYAPADDRRTPDWLLTLEHGPSAAAYRLERQLSHALRAQGCAATAVLAEVNADSVRLAVWVPGAGGGQRLSAHAPAAEAEALVRRMAERAGESA